MHVRIIKKKGRSLFLLSCEILHLIKRLHFPWVWQKKWGLGNFPASPMVKTLLPMQGHDYDPCLGNWDPTSPHLACTPPAVLRHPAIQRVALRTTRADLRRGSRTGATADGCWLLAAGATRTYSHQTTVATPSNTSSQTASPAPHPANATTKAGDGTLQSAASLCDLRLPSTSLLLRDSGEETAVLHHLLNPVQMASVHPVWQRKKRKRSLHWINVLIPHLI